MTVAPPQGEMTSKVPPFETLRAIERRILWLATAIIDHTNRVRPNLTGLSRRVIDPWSPNSARSSG
jgi:pyruvate dehydrogenase E1 component